LEDFSAARGDSEPKSASHAISYAKNFSRSRDAVIRVYDAAGNVIETHEHSSRSTYSDCQFVSEQVNCCVRSCYLYGTRFGYLYHEIKLNSKNLCRLMKPIDLSGMLAAKADVEALKNLTLITEYLARYENTRDPNCKGIKDCETLRGVRTGADTGLARLRKLPEANRVICTKARVATSPLQPWVLCNLR